MGKATISLANAEEYEDRLATEAWSLLSTKTQRHDRARLLKQLSL